jgi:2'-hydroxyisoflavone reductase
MTRPDRPGGTPHSTSRRDFLRTSALVGGAAALGVPMGLPVGSPVGAAAQSPGVGSAGSPPAAARQESGSGRALRILILGGTGFTGPHQVRYAVERGHQVTVFNRGRRQTELPAGVEELVGDRNTGDLAALGGREWDVVIDNPTTLPFWVRDAGEMLREATGQYVFISTLSAYDTRGVQSIDEDTPKLSYADGDPLGVTPDAYQARGGALFGPMKAESEREAVRWFGGRTTIIRPGLIVGPGDQTDRFTYWPVRIARGGDVVAPGTGEDPVQVIDARDLAEWTVRMVENGTTGAFNAVGPRSPMSMAEQLHGIRGALSGDLDVRLHWVPAESLQAQGVRPWSEMTTWFGPGAALARTANARAVEAGLSFRSLAETTLATLDWFRGLPAERQAAMQAGLDPEKEQAVLGAWRAAGVDP